MNVSRVTDQLYTGGDLPSHVGADAMREDLDRIVAEGVTHVVDVRYEFSDEDFVAEHAPHVAYLHIGQDDAGQRMPDSWFDRGVEFALRAMEDPDSKVLAHCHMGVNRGPSMAYAILLASGVDPVEALALIRSARPVAATAYAEDALEWWHRRSGTSQDVAMENRRRVRAWRQENPLDVVRIIRQNRDAEFSGRRFSS